jgi:hypothetical protein
MTMNSNPRRRWLSGTAIGVATAVGAAMLTAPVAAVPRSDDSDSPRGVSDPAVYIIGDRVVAIRRDRVPPGAYGGHGVDYSPGLTAWILDGGCADPESDRTH